MRGVPTSGARRSLLRGGASEHRGDPPRPGGTGGVRAARRRPHHRPRLRSPAPRCPGRNLGRDARDRHGAGERRDAEDRLTGAGAPVEGEPVQWLTHGLRWDIPMGVMRCVMAPVSPARGGAEPQLCGIACADGGPRNAHAAAVSVGLAVRAGGGVGGALVATRGVSVRGGGAVSCIAAYLSTGAIVSGVVCARTFPRPEHWSNWVTVGLVW